MNTELEQRDNAVLKQVKEKLGNLLQQYLFDENDVYQRQAKKTIERVLHKMMLHWIYMGFYMKQIRLHWP